jgi:hypothetical protein
MSTRVIVESGICGFKTTITVEPLGKRKASVTLQSECEMVGRMQEDVRELEMMSVFTGFMSNPVYGAASRCLKHTACPVPSGILKALEVAMGLSLPKNASIVFVNGTGPAPVKGREPEGPGPRRTGRSGDG